MNFVVKSLSHWFKRFWPEIVIGLFALYSRFVGLNWDNGHHLHPDERFLTMTQLSLAIPPTFQTYLDPANSTLNPHNRGQDFYVYGTFPLTLNKVLAVFANTDDYGNATIQGRFLSGLFDVGTIIVIYKLVLALLPASVVIRKNAARLAAASYTLAVLPIQLAHFFAVDSFLTFFITLTILQAVRYSHEPTYKSLAFSAIAFGLAIACKISAVLLFPLVGLLLIGIHWSELFRGSQTSRNTKRTEFIGKLAIWGFITYVVVRLASPNYFATANILNPHLSQKFVQNLTALKSYEGSETWFPPAIQWISKPKIWFSVTNLALFGFGVMLTSMALLESIVLITMGIKTKTLAKQWRLYAVMGWALALFLYQSSQFVQAIRYFIVIYPVLAILAGLGWQRMLNWCANSRYAPLTQGILATIILVWPLAFLSIYHQPHTRVTASEWIYAHVPNHSLLATEYWDDPLPLLLPNQTKQFMGKGLYVFDQDSMEKWHLLNKQLNQTDYYILSSNRAWGSIMAVPEKYPQMSKYYQDLFSDKTDYQLVAEFTSYPSLRYLGIPIDFPTDGADESFTVYDHPKVLIFLNRHSPRQPELVGFGTATQK